MQGSAAGMLLAAALLVLPAQPLAADISIAQADGKMLELPAPATRVITLAPHLTELFYTAGAEDALIATVEYSDTPAAAKTIPRIGDAFQLDLERIVELQPDLLIAWQSGNPQAALRRLEELGLTIWQTEVRQLSDIGRLLRDIEAATGKGDGSNTAQAFQHRIRQIQARYAGSTPVRYFYQVARQPLYTVNGRHFISRALALCGGENVFADLGPLAPTVGLEAVIATAPSAIFAPAAPGYEGQLSDWPKWRQVPAVANGRLYYLDADRINRPTPRLLDAVELACHYLQKTRGAKALKTVIAEKDEGSP